MYFLVYIRLTSFFVKINHQRAPNQKQKSEILKLNTRNFGLRIRWWTAFVGLETPPTPSSPHPNHGWSHQHFPSPLQISTLKTPQTLLFPPPHPFFPHPQPHQSPLPLHFHHPHHRIRPLWRWRRRRRRRWRWLLEEAEATCWWSPRHFFD